MRTPTQWEREQADIDAADRIKKLHAAAPELLGALEKALRWADQGCLAACANEVQKAREVIAKAGGK